jgi:hypothetical protein
MALGDRLVSGVPTGLVGKQRAKKQQGVERQRNYLYCERQQNRTEQCKCQTSIGYTALKKTS